MKTFLPLLIISALFSSGCQGGKPIPEDCLKLLNTHLVVINKMKESGRFADNFIKKHENQWRMIEFLATTNGISNNEEKRQKEVERCRRAYSVIEPQQELSKRIITIPENELEKHFSPPLGFNRKQ